MDDKQQLYPKIDFARQTYHASKTAIRPKVGKKRIEDDIETVTEASTAATSAIGDSKKSNFDTKKGVVINQLSTLSDK